MKDFIVRVKLPLFGLKDFKKKKKEKYIFWKIRVFGLLENKLNLKTIIHTVGSSGKFLHK